MADQVINKNNAACPLMNVNPMRHSQSSPRPNPHAALQYAINEVDMGEVKVPPEIQSMNVPGCIRDFIPPVPQPPQFASRSSPQYMQSTCHPVSQNIGTVSEEGSMDTPQNSVEPQGGRRQRTRRSAVDAMAFMQQANRRHTIQGTQAVPNPVLGTLYVPANHPLLQQQTEEEQRPEYTDSLPNGMKIEIIAPTQPSPEQISVSMRNFTSGEVTTNTTSPMPYPAFAQKTHPAFNEGRRASDGVNTPFKHLLHKTDHRFLQEQLQLQGMYERSITPELIELQQQNHSQFIGRLSQENCSNLLTVNEGTEWNGVPEWGNTSNRNSPMSSQNELMSTMQRLQLQTQDQMELDTDSSYLAPGPHRRQASYRKVAPSPIPQPQQRPQHIRKRRTAVCGDNPFASRSFDSSYEENS